MPRDHLVFHADDVQPFSSPGHPEYASQHVLGADTAGTHDTLLNRGTVRARSALGGGVHPDNDEIYVGVSGRCMVDVGGDPSTGAGATTYPLGPESIVVIPAGTFHRLRNESDEDFVLYTIWPQPAKPGANGIHDDRLAAWGTAFRLRPGRRILAAGGESNIGQSGLDGD